MTKTVVIVFKPLPSPISLLINENNRYQAFSPPGRFAPRSESSNRTLEIFAPWNYRSL